MRLTGPAVVSMMAGMGDLRLLLMHHDDHSRPVLAHGLAAAEVGHARPVDRGERLDSPHLRSLTSDKNALGKQGYCVIAPLGERGDRLLELAKPLIDKRREDVNRERPADHPEQPINILRVPTLAQMGREPSWDDAVDWVKGNLEKPELEEQDIPYYRLILGDLHEVPQTVQQAVTVNGLVGRLAFDRDDDYEAYAAKVLASEGGQIPDRWPDVTMYTVRDETPETEELHRDLTAPTFARLHRNFDLDDWPHDAHQYVCEPPSPAHLLDCARTAAGSVLFTLSHGEGAPRDGWRDDHERQRQFQGAMTFGEGRLCASDVAEGHFLPGGIWFMNACFGAGTPGQSAFLPWLQKLADINYQHRDIAQLVRHSLPAAGVPPFIAALPKAALANPDGPLGFIGHIDLAWTYGFGDHADRNHGHGKRITVLHGVLSSLSQGQRFGACFHHLTHYVNATIASEFPAVVKQADEHGRISDPRYLHLWMMSEDLRGYALLGDPAARILAPGREPWRNPRPRSIRPLDVFAQGARPVPQRPAIDQLERAIGFVLTGSPVAKEAQRLQVAERDLQRWVDRYRDAGKRALQDE